MGIRIHKILGYGLTDVKTDETNDVSDNRFNKNGYIFNPDNYSMKGFIAHIKNKIKNLTDNFEKTKYNLLLHQLEKTTNDLYDCVYYDSYYGMPNVMVFIPPSSDDWTRYNNIIDYYDPQHSDKNGIKNSVIELERPIWPYDLYINIKKSPPEKVVGTDFSIYQIVRENNYEIQDEVLRNKLLSEFDFSSLDDFKKYIIPDIPDELVEFLKYINIFSDDKYIYDLRPIIYSYWS